MEIIFQLNIIQKLRSEEACLKSTLKIIDLAKKCNSRLHVFHLSTKSESKLFEILPLKNKNITSEVCIHHLSFNELRLQGKRGFYKMESCGQIRIRSRCSLGKLLIQIELI